MNASYDIAVVGSGAAGIAAAVTAARIGARTLLLDKHSQLGGTGGLSGLTTLCGLFDDAGSYLNSGFSREFAEAIAEAPPQKTGRVWVLPYRPTKFCAVAEGLFARLPNLQTRLENPLTEVVKKDETIVSLNGFTVGAVIDCTGDAEVARMINVPCLETDETTQAPAVIFKLQNVKRDLETPAEVAQVLLPLARAGFPPLYFHPGVDPDTITAKFTGSPDGVPALIEFLQKNVSGFAECSVPDNAIAHAKRAGRMIVGVYVLTGNDVLNGAHFPDAVARCAWPVEQWNASGFTRCRYLPPATHYEIPARSLRARGVKNLFMAGKTISADADAIASARVMGCCLATGAAAGKLAVDYLNFPHQ